MSKEEALKILLEETSEASTAERLARLEEKLDLILRAIAVRQKDACEIAGITQATARNKALRGELEPLQADGSRANYLTLAQTAKLKPRRRHKRR